jgi:hypothetical protein
MDKRIRRALAVLFLCGLSTTSLAYNSGAIGYTTRPGDVAAGCGTCHGATGGTVTISGPASVTPGSTVAYTVTMSGIPAGTALAGFNLAVTKLATQPTFQTGTGLVIGDSSTQAAHNPGKAPTSGSASWSVNLAIPAGATVGTSYTLYAAANAGRATDQFGWNHAPNHVITVAASLPANPTGIIGDATSTTTTNLTWFGTAPEFRLLRKAGSCPTSPTDAGAINVYTGTAKTAPDTGLTAATTYCYRVWGKASGANTFSASFSERSLTTYPVPTNRYVNAATGNDNGGANNCATVGTPCRTITRAMTAASFGDAITVAPGTYNLALGEVFPIDFKSGVQLVASGTPSNTVIDAAGDTVKNGVIVANDNDSATARIEGFTIRNGLKAELTSCGSPLGGALYISSGVGTFTVTRNVFSGNESRGYTPDGSGGFTGCLAWGGALAVFSHTVHVTNNVFVQNIARAGNGFSHPGTPNTTNENGGHAQGGAIYFGGSGTIINNTFHANSAIGGNGGTTSTGPGMGGTGLGGAIYAIGTPGPSVVNNVLSANVAKSGTGAAPVDPSEAGALLVSGGSPSMTKNLFFGNLVNSSASTGDTPSTSPVNADPQFHSAPGNLHIATGSPAGGAGTATGAPAKDLDGVNRPNPPAIGAYEPTAVAPPDPPRMYNISTRMQVLTGNDVMIGGFVIGGSANKTVAIVATGPSLQAFGIQNPLANPTLTLVRSSDQVTIATNNDWQTAANQAQLQTAGFAPTSPLESAILISLAPGAYTAIVEGVGGGTGVGVVAVYEVDGATIPLTNISTRGRVLTGNDVMIGGFVITGNGPQTVAIVGTGPSLAAFGIQNPLANPTLTLVRSSDQVTLATNDDWQGGCPQVGVCGTPAQLTTAGFAPSNPLESAIYITLQPGAYTAILEGVGGGTGVGVIGVYKVN